jgi:predicted homoserine dehydrogenase-like protein
MAAAGTIGVYGMLSSCSTTEPKKKEEQLPKLLTQAPDGKVLKAGLIGCGGRGTGAAANFLDAGPNLQITALGDVFQDRLDQCRAQLKKEKNDEIDDDKCFIGFDNYQKVIDSGVDVVLLCTRSGSKCRKAYLP